jgi:hypothetical protein
MNRKGFVRLLVTIVACGVVPLPIALRDAQIAHAEQSLWAEVDERTVAAAAGDRIVVPAAYRVFRADPSALTRALGGAPTESSGSSKRAGALVTVPMPDGAVQRFELWESPVMAPGLARAHPDVKTYAGRGIDDPTATARFDRTSKGFHGMILSAHGDVFVDPFARGDVRNYVSYYARNARSLGRRFACLTPGSAATSGLPKGAAIPAPVGGALRTFRLAMAATGEYTRFHGGTEQDGLEAVVTTVNRVNAVYERDLAVRLILVDGNDLIVYTNPANDPYSNEDGEALLDENQANIDNVIGAGNYDIGHVVGTGGGGVAVPGVCAPANKAMGVTGSDRPVGDAFDISYVAHEVGHQFGANHTFNNGRNGSCGGGNRAAEVAYEPGGGTTILSYAGICGPADIQPESDAYFHAASIGEINAWIDGNACADRTATGNLAPTVAAGPGYTIPAGTPFALTAEGLDRDGDELTYCWEEFDLGPESPPEEDDGQRPIFRSFAPAASPTRTFPNLTSVLAGEPAPWEILPSTNRTLAFRVTARDNRAGGGGVASAGPFTVAGPRAGEVWTSGSRRTVTWDVAGTDRGQVGASNVRISISTDGGLTFPLVVAESTPNDGSADLTVPNVSTATARIKVEAVGNIFFHVSQANFTIRAGTGGGTVPIIDEVAPVEVAGRPFRIKIFGDLFLEGVQVYVGGDVEPWSNIKLKNEGTIVLKKGAPLEDAFPVGVPVRIRIVNADGGEAATTFTR